MKVYEQIATLLSKRGVQTMFGLLGDANMYVSSAFERAGGRFVRVAHEASAVSMADAHARMTSELAVATVTHGPGFTNTVTALVEASRFGTPMLLITGDPPPEPTHMQRLDISALCAALGVAHERVHRAETVQRDVDRAIRLLESTRAPVVLNIPVPISLCDTPFHVRDDIPLPSWHAPVHPLDADALDTAMGLAASASRPIIVAGRGVIDSDAQAAVTELAEQLGAALFTSGLGIGLFGEHPRHLGIMGSIAHEEATSVLMDSDCIIAIGTSLNKYTTLGGELFADKPLIHIDSDPVKLGWFVTPTCAVLGDAELVADTMATGLRDGQLPEKTSWKMRSEKANAAIRRWVPADDRSADGTIDIRVATQHLDKLLPPGYTVVSDVGRFIAGSWPYLTKATAGRFTAMTGFGSIGLGIAGGIGAAVSGIAEVTVVLIGDGGFMMHAAELATAVRESLPLLVVVYNDGAYGAEYQKLLNEDFAADHAYNQWPDIAATASALGAHTVTVRSLGDFDRLTAVLPGMTGPIVVDIRLDPTHHLVF